MFAMVAWGDELFDLHLTIDEEIFADVEAWRNWLTQGRWGMALLSRFVLPHPVAPVVSTSLGVLGFCAALLVFLKTWSTSRLTLLAVAFGIVSPALGYLLTFSTISFGVGAAAAASAAPSCCWYETADGWAPPAWPRSRSRSTRGSSSCCRRCSPSSWSPH